MLMFLHCVNLVTGMESFKEQTRKARSQRFESVGNLNERAANPRPQGGAPSVTATSSATGLLRVGSRDPHTSIQTERAAAVPRAVSRTVAGDGTPGDGSGQPGSGLLRVVTTSNGADPTITDSTARYSCESDIPREKAKVTVDPREGGGRGQKRKRAQGGNPKFCLRHRTERIQRRVKQKRAKQVGKQLKERKRKRRMACKRAYQKKKEAALDLRRKDVRGGTWNTRGLGASFGRTDPFLKAQCFFTLFEKRKWDYALLSDLKYSENGVREHRTKNARWTLVVQGKVGIAMSERLAKLWRDGGAIIDTVGRRDVSTTRMVATIVPAKGWKKGLMLLAAYAPTSGTTLELKEERGRFWESLGSLANKAPHGTKLIIGGDMNAEIGARMEGDDSRIVGNHSNGKRSATGVEMLDFCSEQGLTIVGSWFAQNQRATWWHVRYASPHELDHFLLRQKERRICFV